MSVGTRAFADVGLKLFYIQIFVELGLSSLYIMIFGELIIFPVHLMRKGGKVISEPSYEHDVLKIYPEDQMNTVWHGRR